MSTTDSHPFRATPNSKRYTAQLFEEVWANLPIEKRTTEPLFSLDRDKEGLINFRTEYVRDMDPSGYKTSIRLLDGYDHFQMLMKSKWFRDAKKDWDLEIAAKLEGEATSYLRNVLKDDECKTSEKINAAKTLMGKAKAIKTDGDNRTRKIGRPSKEEVEGELKEQARLTKEEADDAARIRLV